jgi:hypothetical protein
MKRLLLHSLFLLGFLGFELRAEDSAPFVQNDLQWTFEILPGKPMRAQLTRGIDSDGGYAKLTLYSETNAKLIAVLSFDQLDLRTGLSLRMEDIVIAGSFTGDSLDFVFRSDLLLDRVNENLVRSIRLSIFAEEKWKAAEGEPKALSPEALYQVEFEPSVILDVQNIRVASLLTGHAFDQLNLARKVIELHPGEDFSLPSAAGRQLVRVTQGTLQSVIVRGSDAKSMISERRTLTPFISGTSFSMLAADAIIVGTDTGLESCAASLRAIGGPAQIVVQPLPPILPKAN